MASGHFCMIEVSIPKAERIVELFSRYPKISEEILEKAISGSLAVLARNTTRGTVPWRTGYLLHSFLERRGRLWGSWGPNVYYAVYVHEGTRPHVILPKFKEALFWEGAEHPVKRVNHPGTKPNPFTEKILRESKKDITELFEDAIRLIKERLEEI